jgi:integral membrane protein
MNDGTPLQVSQGADARSSVDDLRRVGKLEAISFLVLLAVAMPLKYLAGLPLAVKICGWIHGLLFVWFLISLWLAKREAKLSLRQVLTVFVAALLPFGPFLIDRRLEDWRGSTPR